MTDDTGFGAASTFGGPIPTPTLRSRGEDRPQATTTSTPRRCARRRGPHFLPAATITASAWATSRSSPRDIRATPRSSPRAPARSATFSSTTATTRPGSASTTWFRSGCKAPAGPFDQWAGGLGFEYFYGFLGGDYGPVAPGAVREHHAGPAAIRRPELHPDPRHGRSVHQLDPHAARGRARQALLPLFRARQQPRAAPCVEGLDRQVQGEVRPRLGQGARGDAGAAEEAGRRPGQYGADAAPEGNPGLGFAERRSEESLCADDGGLRRHRGPVRLRDRPHPRRPGGIRPARQHAGHLPRGR